MPTNTYVEVFLDLPGPPSVLDGDVRLPMKPSAAMIVRCDPFCQANVDKPRLSFRLVNSWTFGGSGCGSRHRDNDCQHQKQTQET